LQIIIALLVTTILSVLGFVFNLRGVSTKISEITTVIGILSPLLILGFSAFCTCMLIFTVLRLTLPSQRFASDAEEIRRVLDIVRTYLESPQAEKQRMALSVFQAIQELKSSVLKKHKIPYPDKGAEVMDEDDGWFIVWFMYLMSLHSWAKDADLETARKPWWSFSKLIEDAKSS